MLPIELNCDDYTLGEEKIASLNASASKDGTGRIHISLCNMDPKRDATVSCELKGAKASRVSGRVLTSDDINAHNTFDNPEAIKPAAFDGAKLKGDELTVTLPAKSVVVLEIE
jgi:alpha-N-arabinofuranosidase